MLRNTTPLLFPSDLEESKRFYQDVLHFVVADQDDEFVELRCKTISLWLHDDDGIEDDAYRNEIEEHKRGVGMNLCFEVDDVDKYYERVVEQEGAPVEQEPEAKPWGIRRFTVRDPDGYHLQFFSFE
jgi:catechol 2,3-dioxygenase-like lactoylglutathione lyase family enzyme